MPRLFTGLEVPSDLRMRFSFMQSGLDRMRWVEPSDMHITLQFIGDIGPRDAHAVVEALSAADWQAPEIRVGELRTFGREKPRSIYASVAEDEPLLRLAAQQSRLMRQLGLPVESRRFTPHITLGRCKSGIAPQAVAQWLALNGGFSAPSWIADRFMLYSARESTGGGPYRIEESWPLRRVERSLAV